MKKEKPSRIEQLIKKKKIDGKSIRIVINTSDREDRLKLIARAQGEPVKAEIIKSYILLIEQLISSGKEDAKNDLMPFLEDIKGVFKRQTRDDDLNLDFLKPYIWAYRKEFSISEFGKVVRLNNEKGNTFDLETHMVLLRFMLTFLCNKKDEKVLKTIMVCSSCNKLYANGRKLVCSKECNVDFQNSKKTDEQYFSTYNRKSDNGIFLDS